MPTAINLNENRFDVHYGVNRNEKTRVGRRGARRERERTTRRTTQVGYNNTY